MNLKLTILLLSIFFISCSSGDKNKSNPTIHSSFQNQTRFPSNVDTDGDLYSTEEFVKWIETSLQQNNGQALRETFQKLIEERINLYILSETEMKNFDIMLDQKYKQALKKSSNLKEGEALGDNFNFDISKLENNQYVNLNTIWRSTEETRFKLHSYFSQMLDLAFNLDVYKKSGSFIENPENLVKARKIALDTLRWFYAGVLSELSDSKNIIRKLALQDILDMFLEIKNEYNSKIEYTLKNDKDAFYEKADYVVDSAKYIYSNLGLNLQNVVVTNSDVMMEMYKKNKDKILAKYSDVKKDFKNKIKSAVQETTKQIEQFFGREPNAKTPCFYEPSVGTCGDMMGFAYDPGTWVLTFDDGPHPTRTLDIINFLGERNINAIFFTLGKNYVSIKKNEPEVFNTYMNAFKKYNMTLGNHSMTHPQMSKLADEPQRLKYEIPDVSKLYSESSNFGTWAEYMRLPYGDGAKNQTVRQVIKDAKMIHMFWNVDTLDWQDKNPDSILERAWKQMVVNQRGIVLFHDIHPQSIIAAKKLTERVLNHPDSKKFKFKFRPINEVKSEMNSRVSK